MKRVLIVNADDCNLTAGVTHAILDCHDHGILTSTTFMANLPVQKETVRQILKRKNLGVGIHLNVTFGKPVSKPDKIKSLVDQNGLFLRHSRMILQRSSPLGGGNPRACGSPTTPQGGCFAEAFGDDVAREYQSQIARFTEVFGKAPTHLDTHHQVHGHPFFLKVLVQIAEKNNLPMRRSMSFRSNFMSSPHGFRRGPASRQVKSFGDDIALIRTTDFFFGNLSPAGYWTREPLEAILKNLPAGVSEIMCHPGRNDAALRQVSSFREGRQKEWHLFRSPSLRKIVDQTGIVLAHFGCAILI